MQQQRPTATKLRIGPGAILTHDDVGRLWIGSASLSKATPTLGRVDSHIAKILPLLPLKDAANLTPLRARAELTALAQSRKDTPLPQPASVAEMLIPGAASSIRARVYRPAKLPVPTVLFFHGGGWVAGDLDTHDRFARTLSIDLEAVVVAVDYRRPPEMPFPASLEDCVAATRWAVNNIAELGGDKARLAVAGDSAGGNLAAAVAQACRERGLQLVAQLLVYPATDLVGAYRSQTENAKYPSRAHNGDGYFLTSDAMRWFASQYVPNVADALDPRASPLRASDLTGLPPAVICTAEFDPLRDEGEAYARALEKAGVRVAYYREPGMIHAYFGMGAASPAAAEAVRRALAGFAAMLRS
jgi:acetyl esterase